MNDRIILQTVRRQNQTLELLVSPRRSGWELISAESIAPNLPVETALQTAEAIHGHESVCSLWKLGSVVSAGCLHHIYCLDLESIAGEPESGCGLTWLAEERFFQALPADFLPLMKKILLIK